MHDDIVATCVGIEDLMSAIKIPLKKFDLPTCEEINDLPYDIVASAHRFITRIKQNELDDVRKIWVMQPPEVWKMYFRIIDDYADHREVQLIKHAGMVLRAALKQRPDLLVANKMRKHMKKGAL